MKLDFMVYRTHPVADLFTEERGLSPRNIPLPVAASVIAKQRLACDDALICTVLHGKYGGHVSTVIRPGRVSRSALNTYPCVASGPYCEMIKVWRAYALLSLTHHQGPE